MAQVMPDLRRVLDGDTPPAGLTDGDLLELYRRMILLRTYDERSVVYHRQGRIGTYAIFWNHEAIQVGATYAPRTNPIADSRYDGKIQSSARSAYVAPTWIASWFQKIAYVPMRPCRW